MPLPFATSPLHHPVLRAVPATPEVPWTAESLVGLDWYRLGELLRAVAVNGGCQLGPSRVGADAAVQFAMLAAPGAADQRPTLVRLTQWNEWGATPGGVNRFAWELRKIKERTHGILIAPGGATPAAMSRARELGVEVIDAHKLCRALVSLHPEQSAFFHSITMAGDHSTPSCPICLRKLTKVEQGSPTGAMRRPDELTFQASTVVPDPVDCERLEVAPGCEVTFLHEVRARRDVLIRGHASGDVICLGTFALWHGGSFTGTVAARGIDIQDGAQFEGDARILESVAQTLNYVEPAWYWRCQHPSGTPECRKVLFVPHSEGESLG
jgi:hypothetical protein